MSLRKQRIEAMTHAEIAYCSHCDSEAMEAVLGSNPTDYAKWQAKALTWAGPEADAHAFTQIGERAVLMFCFDEPHEQLPPTEPTNIPLTTRIFQFGFAFPFLWLGFVFGLLTFVFHVDHATMTQCLFCATVIYYVVLAVWMLFWFFRRFRQRHHFW